MRRAAAFLLILCPLFAEAPPASGPKKKEKKDRATAKKALAWLLKQDGLLNAQAGNGFQAGKGLCALAATGFLLEQFPRYPKFAKHRARLLEQLAPHIRAGAMAQGTWSDGFFGLYLAERSLRKAKGDDELWTALVRRIEDGQNADGGWSHGGVEIGFYPSTLIAATNLSALTLGLARRLKKPTDGDVLDAARGLYRDLQSAAGAWPYGGRPYRKGFEAGRTAGAVVALRALGRKEDADLIARARHYLALNADRIPHGHASPAMHILSGALAFAIQKASPSVRSVLDPVVRNQNPDGTFRDVVPFSPDSLELMGKTKQNDAYLTALYAAALVARGSKVAELLRDETAAADTPSDSPDHPKPAWTANMSDVAGLATQGDQLIAVGSDGALLVRDAGTGQPAGADARAELAPGHVVHAAWGHDETLFLISGKPQTRVQPVRILNGVASTKPPELTLAAVDAATRKSRWSASFQGLGGGAVPSGKELLITSRVAPPRRVRLADGKDLGPLPSPKGVVNRAVAVAPDGRIAVSGEREVWALAPDGSRLWSKRARVRRKLLAPAKGALAWLGTKLIEGTTAGTVRCRNGETGKSIWKVRHRAAIDHIAVVGQRIVVLGADGALLCLDEHGETPWRHEPATGRELGVSRGALQVSASLVAAVGPHGSLRILDLATGKLVARLPYAPGDRFLLAGRRLFTTHGNAVASYDFS